jgi:hypothetical protein
MFRWNASRWLLLPLCALISVQAECFENPILIVGTDVPIGMDDLVPRSWASALENTLGPGPWLYSGETHWEPGGIMEALSGVRRTIQAANRAVEGHGGEAEIQRTLVQQLKDKTGVLAERLSGSQAPTIILIARTSQPNPQKEPMLQLAGGAVSSADLFKAIASAANGHPVRLFVVTDSNSGALFAQRSLLPEGSSFYSIGGQEADLNTGRFKTTLDMIAGLNKFVPGYLPKHITPELVIFLSQAFFASSKSSFPLVATPNLDFDQETHSGKLSQPWIKKEREKALRAMTSVLGPDNALQLVQDIEAGKSAGIIPPNEFYTGRFVAATFAAQANFDFSGSADEAVRALLASIQFEPEEGQPGVKRYNSRETTHYEFLHDDDLNLIFRRWAIERTLPQLMQSTEIWSRDRWRFVLDLLANPETSSLVFTLLVKQLHLRSYRLTPAEDRQLISLPHAARTRHAELKFGLDPKTIHQVFAQRDLVDFSQVDLEDIPVVNEFRRLCRAFEATSKPAVRSGLVAKLKALMASKALIVYDNCFAFWITNPQISDDLYRVLYSSLLNLSENQIDLDLRYSILLRSERLYRTRRYADLQVLRTIGQSYSRCVRWA